MQYNKINAGKWLIDFFSTNGGKAIALFYITVSLLVSGLVIFSWFNTGSITIEEARPVVIIILPIIICLFLMKSELNSK
ncbi:hypothetical protein ABT56_18940 [Photobacterium aquae]|uniref:Uncharacterized protein n=1 Tax=Photobacterium aquae TaxID=1195763 RepID=A0A0J1GV58_9GAMM|nr:hypothetical protein [Photobacterium aquae]KLV03511.1 hypothetical protein ABT56_18940 [Photobacterium aquae]